MFRISLRGETHTHQCGYNTYCRDDIEPRDRCRPPTKKEEQALKLLRELGWSLDLSVRERLCDMQADENGTLHVDACSACAGHYYS